MFTRKAPICATRYLVNCEGAIDNSLVRQKEFILKLINNGAYREAWFALQTVGEMWEQLSYGYKYNELMERIEKSGFTF